MSISRDLPRKSGSSNSLASRPAGYIGFGVVAAIVLFVLHPSTAASRRRLLVPDYSLGKPRLWSYQRVYPFLDGIFQDVASTQVTSLQLNASSANGSTLNALQNAFQAGVSFSAPIGAQNALSQQENAVVSANSALQTQLLTQQAQLTQQVVAAMQQVNQDTLNLNQLQSSPNPDATQVSTAQTTLQTANANLATLNSQLSTVRAQIPSTLIGQQTYNAPSAPTPQSTTLPSGILGATAPPGAPQTPSFPVSKQMDNQVNLLWERLARLVGTLTQSDSLAKYKLVLASFNVNLMPLQRKKEVFAVQYDVVGVSSATPPATCNARVVDLFPSASAVNIVNNKYKENRVGLSAVASWFSFGLNASYNRDHLQISQALGQSAYITGFGAGTSKFGWAFGRNLGDDSVSPGNRTLFAIIAVPMDCDQVSISPERAGWFAENSDNWYRTDKVDEFKKIVGSNALSSTECMEVTTNFSGQGACTVPTQTVTQITYTPVEFDPSSQTNNPATLQIELSRPIDPQLTVSIDGRIVTRARDTFGRAVVNAGGSGGLLESNTYGVNSWIPISSTTLSISLNPAMVERRFPEIVFSSPLSGASVSQFLPRMAANDVSQVVNTAYTTIASGKFTCVDPCVSNMPPLSYRKASPQQLIAFHWDIAKGTKQERHQLFISLLSDSSGTQNAAAANGQARLQVLTSQGPSPWGANTVVTIELPPPPPAADKPISTAPSQYRLQCQPLDSRLRCALPAQLPNNTIENPLTIQVHDPDHAGGAVSAWKSWAGDGQEGAESMVLWNAPQPTWVSSAKGGKPDTLAVCFGIINLTSADKATLLLQDINGGTTIAPQAATPTAPAITFDTKQCLGDSPELPTYQAELRVPISRFRSLSDQMSLSVVTSSSPMPLHLATLLNFSASALPVVWNVSPDNLKFYGQNLVFNKLRAGDTADPINLDCDNNGTSCVVSDKSPKFPASAMPLYFLDADDLPTPVYKLVAGVLTPVQSAVPPAKDSTGGKNGSGGGTNQGSFQFSISGSANGSSQGSAATQPTQSSPAAAAPTPPQAPAPPAPPPNTAPFAGRSPVIGPMVVQ